MEYKVIKSKRRTIALEISSEAKVIVRAPVRVSDFVIKQIIQKRQAWITKKLLEVRKRVSKKVVKRFIEGEVFLFLGKKYELQIVEKQKQKIVFDKAIFLREKELLRAKEVIIKWYKNEALNYFADRVSEMARELGFVSERVFISNARKRWGTCNSKNDLRFNWRLIMAPAEVMDYVILHELVHTKVKNHSKKYWAWVKKIMPDYKKHERWIKENKEEMFWE